MDRKEEDFFSEILAEEKKEPLLRKLPVKPSKLDDLERELAPREPSAADELKELQRGLGAEKLKSPELAGEEEQEATPDDEDRRRILMLRIREILASNARDRAERLKALMAQAPRGMESVIADVIRKYSPVLNEPTPPIEPPAKVELQTATIFRSYSETEKKSSDPYKTSSDTLYSGGGKTPDFAEVRLGVDTSAETVVKRMTGRLEEEKEPDSYANI